MDRVMAVEVGLYMCKLSNGKLAARTGYAFTALKITNQNLVNYATEATQKFPNFVRVRCKLDHPLGRNHLRAEATDARDEQKRWAMV